MPHGSACFRAVSLVVLGSLACLASLVSAAWPQEKMTAGQVTELLAAGGNLEGADLRELALPGLTFASVQAARSLWDGADLRGAIFRQANLTGASLVGANLRGACLEQVDLTGAKLTRADLNGSRLRGLTLVRADLAGADLRGAEVAELRFSPAGDRFLPALALVVERLLPAGSEQAAAGLPWAAGLSTTGFAFTLNSADLSQWPGTPLTLAPLLAAGEALGAQVTLKAQMDRGEAFFNLNRALREGALCLLPLDMSEPGQTGDGLQEPLWTLAERIEGQGKQAVCVLQAPPFGELRLLAEDLNARWGKTASTLLPVDQKPAQGRYVMVIYKPGAVRWTRSQVAATALRNAVATLSHTQARGSHVGGVAGLQQLVSMARVALGARDAQGLAQLVAWSAGPRLDLAGSRALAADFLASLAEVFPADQGMLLQQAATQYRAEARALQSQWVDLAGLDLAASDLDTTPVEQDVALLAEAAASEEQALALLQRLVREAR